MVISLCVYILIQNTALVTSYLQPYYYFPNPPPPLNSIPIYHASTVLVPTSSRPFCSHHFRVTCATGLLYVSMHSSSICQIIMYWAILFWQQRTYFSTSSSPISDITTSTDRNTYCPIMSLCGLITTSHRSTLWWNPHRFHPPLGFVNQVLDPNKRVSFATSLKEDLEVHALAPSRPKILEETDWLKNIG